MNTSSTRKKSEPELAGTRDLFARHGLRCTRQRTALYRALRRCGTHPSADDLYRMVKPSAARLSRATVYNTLDALCRAGLVRRLPTSYGTCRYDADTRNHLHLDLPDTADIRDVPDDLGEKLLREVPADVLAEIEARMGVKIDGVNIQLSGRAARQTQPVC